VWTLASLLALLGLCIAASSALAYDPIEGYWASQASSSGRIKVQRTSGNNFTGTITGGPGSCTPDSDGFYYYPPGSKAFDVTAGSDSYTGTEYSVNPGDCSPAISQEVNLRLSADGNTMRHCTGSGQCTTLIKLAPPDWPDSTGPAPSPPTPGAPAVGSDPGSGSGGIPSSWAYSYTFKYVAVLPSQKARCRSRRHFYVHLRSPIGTYIRSAVLRVAGRVRSTFGRTLVVDLRGLPRGRFVVAIVARTANGHTIRGSRVYRTCVHRRRARSKHRL